MASVTTDRSEVSASTTALSTRRVWTGRVLTGLAVAFLVFDGVIKFSGLPAVTDSFVQLGMPTHLATTIGALELACLAVYLVPRTAVLGAVLFTGYLGGAIALHLRAGDPMASHVLFPTYIAALLWGGLYAREPRLRALLPLRT